MCSHRLHRFRERVGNERFTKQLQDHGLREDDSEGSLDERY